MESTLEKLAGLIGIEPEEANALRGKVFEKTDPIEVEKSVRAYCDYLRSSAYQQGNVEMAIRKADLAIREEQLAKIRAERELVELRARAVQATADLRAKLGGR
jgi:hypothetical protein